MVRIFIITLRMLLFAFDFFRAELQRCKRHEIIDYGGKQQRKDINSASHMRAVENGNGYVNIISSLTQY